MRSPYDASGPREEFGTLKAFGRFVVVQANFYQLMMQEHFKGLPCPETFPREHCELSVLPDPERLSPCKTPSESVTIGRILFRREEFNMFGERVRLWVKV